jgi:hypothetical protein
MSPSNGFFPNSQFETRYHEFDYGSCESSVFDDEMGFDFMGCEVQFRVQKWGFGREEVHFLMSFRYEVLMIVGWR